MPWCGVCQRSVTFLYSVETRKHVLELINHRVATPFKFSLPNLMAIFPRGPPNRSTRNSKSLGQIGERYLQIPLPPEPDVVVKLYHSYIPRNVCISHRRNNFTIRRANRNFFVEWHWNLGYGWFKVIKMAQTYRSYPTYYWSAIVGYVQLCTVFELGLFDVE